MHHTQAIVLFSIKLCTVVGLEPFMILEISLGTKIAIKCKRQLQRRHYLSFLFPSVCLFCKFLHPEAQDSFWIIAHNESDGKTSS